MTGATCGSTAHSAAVSTSVPVHRWRVLRRGSRSIVYAENVVYQYDPTFIMRGLSALHIEFEPV